MAELSFQDDDSTCSSLLDLKCGRSDYDVDDLESNDRGMLPYQFEPTVSDTSDSGDIKDKPAAELQSRRLSTDWQLLIL